MENINFAIRVHRPAISRLDRGAALRNEDPTARLSPASARIASPSPPAAIAPHSCVAIDSGGDGRVTISHRLGHASPTIALNVYGHVFSNTDDRAAEIMEVAFSRRRTE
jgi:integrase